MRRIRLLVGFVGVVTLGVGALVLPARAGTEPPEDAPTTFVIRKVVNGPATAGSTVAVNCGGETAVLTFDKTGAPDTTSVGSFTKVDGAWMFFTSLPEEPSECTSTETSTGGAASTSWTCSFLTTEPEVPRSQQVEDPEPGCAAAAGTGTGPVVVVYGNLDDDIETQVSTVTFTNTYVAPVNTAPTFTG